MERPLFRRRGQNAPQFPLERVGRAENALERLHELGFDSVASLLDVLLESNSVGRAECRQMLKALMKREEVLDSFLADQEICCNISSYASKIATKEMAKLVAHKALRLPVTSVNPESLDAFDPETIARLQRTCAPMITSILRTCAGENGFDDAEHDSDDTDDTDDSSDDTEDAGLPNEELELGDPRPTAQRRGRDRQQIATISLCMLSYAQNHQSNVLQMATGYFAYADNTSKRMVEILHRMGLLVTYETIRRALKENAKAISKQLEDKAWKSRFFLFYDNMNFYRHRRDERLHNRSVQVAYTAGYVHFMHSEHDENEDANWKQCFLDADQIDYSAANQLTFKDVMLCDEDLEHQARSARYMMSKTLIEYFPASCNRQKTRLSDGRLMPKFMKEPMPLSNIQCRRESSVVIPLPTLAIDEAFIEGTIDILRTYMQRLGLKDWVVKDKTIMFKGDFLTVRNMRRAIYRRQCELQPID